MYLRALSYVFLLCWYLCAEEFANLVYTPLPFVVANMVKRHHGDGKGVEGKES